MPEVAAVAYQRRPTARTIQSMDAVIIHGFPIANNQALLEYAGDLGNLSNEGITSTTNPLEDDAVHLVQDREVPAHDPYNNVMISTTNLDFPLHTDEYFAARPARYVLLLCVVPASSGGTALVSYIRDVIPDLDQETLKVLTLPIFPSHVGAQSILSYSGSDDWNVRFNDLEMNRANRIREDIAPLSISARAAIGEFKSVIQNHVRKFEMKQGDCLVLCNHRVLHGRTAFPKGDLRRLKRVRIK